MIRRTLHIGVALAVWCSSPACQKYPCASAEQIEVFELLDGFDDRDHSSRPFVVIAQQESIHQATRYDVATFYRCRHGYLLDSDEGSFVVQLVNGNRLRLKPTLPDPLTGRRTQFSPADIKAFARHCAERVLRASNAEPSGYEFIRPEHPAHTIVQGLLVARACARLNLEDELATLWTSLPSGLRQAASIRSGRGDGARWLLDYFDARIILDLGDPTLTWHDHLARTDFLVDTITAPFWVDRWTKRRDQLRKRIDELPRQQIQTPLAERSNDELVKDLAEVCHPVNYWMFGHDRLDPMDPGTTGPDCYQELLSRGISAVPALLRRLEDETPTRSWSYFSRFGGSFSGMSRGEVARKIVDAIAGVESRFSGFDPTEWHRRIRTMGFENYLIGVVEDPTTSCAVRPEIRRLPQWDEKYDSEIRCGAAKRLLEVAPERLPEILTVAESLTNQWDLADLLEAVVNDTKRRGEPLPRRLTRLLDAMSEGEFDSLRLRAAKALLDFGHTSGVCAVAAALPDDFPPSQEEIMLFLSSGEAAVWPTVEARVLDPEVPRLLVTCLGKLHRREVTRTASPENAAVILTTLRRMLGVLLRDDTALADGARTLHRGRFVDLHTATIADLAATHLNRWWPDDYPFDPTSTRSTRRLQIAALRGERPKPMPTHRSAETSGALRIATVEIAPEDAPLPAAAKKRIAGLAGEAANGRSLLEALILAADSRPAQVVTFDLERPREHADFRLRCRISKPTEQDDSSRIGILATANGQNIARKGARTGQLDLEDLHEYVWLIEHALERPYDEGVELTVHLHKR